MDKWATGYAIRLTSIGRPRFNRVRRRFPGAPFPRHPAKKTPPQRRPERREFVARGREEHEGGKTFAREHGRLTPNNSSALCVLPPSAKTMSRQLCGTVRGSQTARR